MTDPIREVAAFDTRAEALAAQDDLAATLEAMGQTDRFGVLVRYINRRGWAVLLRDRTVGP